MRIVYVCPDHGIPVFGRKGCSTHVRETCRALARRGHQVVLLAALLKEHDDDPVEDLGIEVRHVPHLRAKWAGADVRLMLYNRRVVKACHDLFKEFEPDLVYERYSLYSTASGSIAQRLRLPYMLEVNTMLADEQARRLRFGSLARRVERGIWRGAPAVVAVSTPVGEELARLGIDPQRIRVMTMAVDVERFVPRASMNGRGLPELGPEGWLKVVYAGALTAWHGTDRFFELAGRLKEGDRRVRLIVVGGTPSQVEPLRARAAEAGLDAWLTFRGSVAYTEVPRMLAAADLGLLAETSKYSSPTKMFEYMAAGLPTLAPRQPAIEEVLRHEENALLFDPNDLEGLIAALVRVGDDPAFARRLGERARADAVASHSWDRNAADIETFHADIVQHGWL